MLIVRRELEAARLKACAPGSTSEVVEPESAVDRENLAGDKLRRGGEEQNRGGDFVGAAIALHGGLFGHAANRMQQLIFRQDRSCRAQPRSPRSLELKLLP